MIGKQINFYMTPVDQRLLLEKIHAEVGCVLIKRDDQQPYHGVEEFMRAQSDWATAYLCQASQVEELLSVVRDGPPNPLLLAAIQFRQPVEERGEIRPGRFWYAQTQPANGEWVKKPDEFVRWAESVFKIARRQLSSLGDGRRIGAEAKSRYEEGLVKLAL